MQYEQLYFTFLLGLAMTFLALEYWIAQEGKADLLKNIHFSTIPHVYDFDCCLRCNVEQYKLVSSKMQSARLRSKISIQGNQCRNICF